MYLAPLLFAWFAFRKDIAFGLSSALRRAFLTLRNTDFGFSVTRGNFGRASSLIG
jgi:hypothetical protein